MEVEGVGGSECLRFGLGICFFRLQTQNPKSCELESKLLEGGYIGDHIGFELLAYKGDTRSLNSFRP